MRYPTVAADPPDRLWEAAADGDAHAAVDIPHETAADAVGEKTPFLEVLAPVQEGAGAERAAGRTTVAQEHATTATDGRPVATLTRRRPAPERHAPSHGRVTAGCVDGAWHAVPARLVAEVLRPRGRRPDHPGARTPTRHLAAHPHRTNPHAVPLPGSPPTHLPAAHAVGADAVPEADLGRPGPVATRQVADALPHLADQEHTAFPTRTADTLEARHAPAAPGVPPRPASAARGGAAVLDRTPRPVPGPPIQA